MNVYMEGASVVLGLDVISALVLEVHLPTSPPSS